MQVHLYSTLKSLQPWWTNQRKLINFQTLKWLWEVCTVYIFWMRMINSFINWDEASSIFIESISYIVILKLQGLILQGNIQCHWSQKETHHFGINFLSLGSPEPVMEFCHLSSCQEDLSVQQTLSLSHGDPLNNTYMVHQPLQCLGRAFNNYVDDKRGEGVSRKSTGVNLWQ